MVSDAQVATVVFLSVAASFPCFLYGAWIMIDNERITWGVLTYHLKFILTGLTLTTVPLVGWMIPRLFDQLGGFAAVHAFFGLQAYAFLLFGFTGIVRIFRAKHRLLEEIGGDNMQFWRRRLRIGVFGYVGCWLVAFLTGFMRYLLRYVV
ncbi:hypothetical protein BRC84_00545 [Halobacteriales archaeon QS_1_68_44]|nr:MAG: hypothetical protein BRC84_00545 [Halobacteriales archaeon QS_1_68_44]